MKAEAPGFRHGAEAKETLVPFKKTCFSCYNGIKQINLDPTPGLGESHAVARVRAPAALTEDIDPLWVEYPHPPKGITAIVWEISTVGYARDTAEPLAESPCL